MTKVCGVGDCQRPFYAKGMCKKHYTHKAKFGYAEAEVKWSALKGNNNAGRGDEVGYYGMHMRLRKINNSPVYYDCEHCDDLADDWAYIHDCIEERPGPRPNQKYCLHLDHYIPLCRSCHRKFDINYGTEETK